MPPLVADGRWAEAFPISAFGLVRRREPTWACLVAAGAYADGPSGSIPLFLMASEARPEARNSISRLEASISPEPATTAAENTCTNWISGAMRPAKSTPAACRISLTGKTARSAFPPATIAGCVRAPLSQLDVDPFGDAEPRKKIMRKPDAGSAPRNRDAFGLQQRLLEALDGAHVGLPRSRRTPPRPGVLAQGPRPFRRQSSSRRSAH